MTDARPCPVPAIDQALAPYLRTRQEASAIRRTLARYLAAHVRPINTSSRHSQHLHLQNPSNLKSGSLALSGDNSRRSKYLQTIHTQSVAREQLRNLQCSLSEQRGQYLVEAASQPESVVDREGLRDYMLLLHQRGRSAELRVVLDSLEKLLGSEAAWSHNEPKAVVHNAIGEQPNLPSERLESLERDPEINEWVFRLKKELLNLRAKAERSHQDRADMGSSMPTGRNTSLAGQVYALIHARRELVNWVETALARMTDEDTELLDNASPVKPSLPQRRPPSNSPLDVVVQQLYQEYTASRSAVIDAVEPLTSPGSRLRDSHASNEAQTSIPEPALASSQRRDHAALDIETYLHELIDFSKRKKSLLDNSVYQRVLLSSASEAIKDRLVKLSNESVLLPSNAHALTAWTKTSNQSQAAIEQSVREYLRTDGPDGHSLEKHSTLATLCWRIASGDRG